MTTRRKNAGIAVAMTSIFNLPTGKGRRSGRAKEQVETGRLFLNRSLGKETKLYCFQRIMIFESISCYCRVIVVRKRLPLLILRQTIPVIANTNAIFQPIIGSWIDGFRAEYGALEITSDQ